MRARCLLTIPPLLAAAFVVGGCETASTSHDPGHPRAEEAQQVVDAFVTAYAEYRGIETRPVGLAVDSWLRIPDSGLAKAMATLDLPRSETLRDLSPAPWTLSFPSFQSDPRQIVADIVDASEPHYGLMFILTVKGDGTIGQPAWAGFSTVEEVR